MHVRCPLKVRTEITCFLKAPSCNVCADNKCFVPKTRLSGIWIMYSQKKQFKTLQSTLVENIWICSWNIDILEWKVDFWHLLLKFIFCSTKLELISFKFVILPWWTVQQPQRPSVKFLGICIEQTFLKLIIVPQTDMSFFQTHLQTLHNQCPWEIMSSRISVPANYYQSLFYVLLASLPNTCFFLIQNIFWLSIRKNCLTLKNTSNDHTINQTCFLFTW